MATTRKETDGRSRSYDAPKSFEGKRYTGMAVGRRHFWRYDAGEWVERKITPDDWEIHYAVRKHRKGRAPEGSGAPIGTEYHWFVLAHQIVKKLDANTYSTELAGKKVKLAHKRAEKDAWSASDRAQKRRLATELETMAAEIRAELETAGETPARAPRTPKKTRAPKIAPVRSISRGRPTNGTHARAA